MKVTTEGERVIDLLWDVIAAKGFEKDTYFEMAARDIRAPAEARGHRAREHGAGPEVHGQLPLQPGRVSRRCRSAATPPTTSSSSARARRAGLGKIQFHDWRAALRRVRRRAERGALHGAGRGPAGAARAPRRRTRTQQQGPRLPAHARRALHAGRLRAADPRAGGADGPRRATRSTRSSTCSCATSPAYAVTLHGQPSSTEAQQAWALEHVRKPVGRRRSASSRVWEQVAALAGAYEMRA